MQLSNILLIALGATAFAAENMTTGTRTGTGAASTQTGSSGKGSGGGKGGGSESTAAGAAAKATGTSSSKSTKTSGVPMSTGGANSLMGNKKEMVTVAGLGVAFAVFL